MSKNLVLFAGAVLLSLLAAWGAYEFYDSSNYTIIISVALFFLVGIWKCLLSYFPRRRDIKETCTEIMQLIVYASVLIIMLLILITWLQEDMYSTASDWFRIKEAISQTGIKLVLFLFGCGTSFVIGYSITAKIRRKLSI
ncbi:MAG: hypothetical protein WD335_02545 [Candidatus Paceibacterota bacterium]